MNSIYGLVNAQLTDMLPIRTQPDKARVGTIVTVALLALAGLTFLIVKLCRSRVTNPAISPGIPAENEDNLLIVKDNAETKQVGTLGSRITNPAVSLFSTSELTHQYIKGAVFDTCIINGESFALIVTRSIQALTDPHSGNVVIDSPYHHLVVLDPVSVPGLALRGKSVTVITPLNIAGDLELKAPRNMGNVILYGENVDVTGNANVIAYKFITAGCRIETDTVEENGDRKEWVINYRDEVKQLFRAGIENGSSSTIAHALLKAGHEILFIDGEEINRSDIFSLWGIPHEG